MQDGVRDRGGFGLKRLKDQEKAFVISSCQSRKSSHFLKRLVIFDIGQLECPY